MSVEFNITEQRTVCFVNSETIPEKTQKLPQYTYLETTSGKEFYQLIEEFYLHEETIWYRLYTWQKIHPKRGTEQILTNMIDAFKSVHLLTEI